jgi:tRNA(fMet)-specific endonuclease VapC
VSFLLDTDICSAHLKRSFGLMHRFVLHSGGLHTPTIVLGELYTRQGAGRVAPEGNAGQ